MKHRQNRSKKVATKIWTCVFISAAVMAAASAAYAQSVQEMLNKIQHLTGVQRKAVLEEGAKKERTLAFYTSMSQADNPKLMSAFEKAHPYLKTEAYRSTSSGVVIRANNEAKAGRHSVDVIGTGAVEMWQLKVGKLSHPYLSPERAAFPKGSYDPEGYWAAFEVTPIVLAYNTKQVPNKDVPQSYEDLLNPKWKGKMNLGTEEYEWFSVMLDALGKNKGLEYMKQLARQNLHMPGAGSRIRVELMLAGESAVSIAARGRRVTEFKERGAPIDLKILEPYPAEPNFVSLMTRAPHPHAAILFFDWMLSQEGQAALADIPRITIRKGAKQKGRLQELLQKEFVFANPASLGANLKEIISQYQQIFVQAK
jgi:iron(III) transport system substrate-binding protein